MNLRMSIITASAGVDSQTQKGNDIKIQDGYPFGFVDHHLPKHRKVKAITSQHRKVKAITSGG